MTGRARAAARGDTCQPSGPWSRKATRLPGQLARSRRSRRRSAPEARAPAGRSSSRIASEQGRFSCCSSVATVSALTREQAPAPSRRSSAAWKPSETSIRSASLSALPQLAAKSMHAVRTTDVGRPRAGKSPASCPARSGCETVVFSTDRSINLREIQKEVRDDVVTGVDFVCVPSADFERALEFYGEVLGLERSSALAARRRAAGGRRVRDRQHDDRGDRDGGARDRVQPQQRCRSPCRSMTSRRPGPSSSRAASSFHGETIDSGVCHIANFRDPRGQRPDAASPLRAVQAARAAARG